MDSEAPKAKGGSGNENWKASERNLLWTPAKKVKVTCDECKHQFFLTSEEMAKIVKHVLMGQMAEDYDAPTREMLYGALDKTGARAIGRELRRQIISKKSTVQVKQRAMEILATLMKHHESRHPPQLDIESMPREALERELDRRLGIPSDEAEVDTHQPPAWMQKVLNETVQTAEPATGGADESVQSPAG